MTPRAYVWEYVHDNASCHLYYNAKPGHSFPYHPESTQIKVELDHTVSNINQNLHNQTHSSHQSPNSDNKLSFKSLSSRLSYLSHKYFDNLREILVLYINSTKDIKQLYNKSVDPDHLKKIKNDISAEKFSFAIIDEQVVALKVYVNVIWENTQNNKIVYFKKETTKDKNTDKSVNLPIRIKIELNRYLKQKKKKNGIKITYENLSSFIVTTCKHYLYKLSENKMTKKEIDPEIYPTINYIQNGDTLEMHTWARVRNKLSVIDMNLIKIESGHRIAQVYSQTDHASYTNIIKHFNKNKSNNTNITYQSFILNMIKYFGIKIKNTAVKKKENRTLIMNKNKLNNKNCDNNKRNHNLHIVKSNSNTNRITNRNRSVSTDKDYTNLYSNSTRIDSTNSKHNISNSKTTIPLFRKIDNFPRGLNYDHLDNNQNSHNSENILPDDQVGSNYINNTDAEEKYAIIDNEEDEDKLDTYKYSNTSDNNITHYEKERVMSTNNELLTLYQEALKTIDRLSKEKRSLTHSLDISREFINKLSAENKEYIQVIEELKPIQERMLLQKKYDDLYNDFYGLQTEYDTLQNKMYLIKQTCSKVESPVNLSNRLNDINLTETKSTKSRNKDDISVETELSQIKCIEYDKIDHSNLFDAEAEKEEFSSFTFQALQDQNHQKLNTINNNVKNVEDNQMDQENDNDNDNDIASVSKISIGNSYSYRETENTLGQKNYKQLENRKNSLTQRVEKFKQTLRN